VRQARRHSPLRVLGRHLGDPVLRGAAAPALGIAVSLPLLIAARRSAHARWPVPASRIETVPGIARLAHRRLGWRLPALGFLPSRLALTLDSLLPILRNGITAIRNRDPAILQAVGGVGMTSDQRLRRVDLPLAAALHAPSCGGDVVGPKNFSAQHSLASRIARRTGAGAARRARTLLLRARSNGHPGEIAV
jgi:ABC-type proline/glycine betaine transport system permease subunit